VQIDLVIAQLKARAPIFAGNVAGAAEYENAVKDQTWLKLPAAYVVPLDMDAGENQLQTGLIQVVTERVGVIVVMDNRADRRGQGAAVGTYQTQAAIFRAILNWRPDSSGDNPGAQTGNWQADHESRGFTFAGGFLRGWDLARLFYEFDFALDVTITDDDGWQPEAVPLTDIAMTIIDQSTGATLAVVDAAPFQDPLAAAGGPALTDAAGALIFADPTP